jgi:small-conductance mechanosensitive channel
MADETNQSQGEDQGGQQEEPDYKELYEQEKAHSRKWEKQAKANKAAADELERAQQAQKTADEKIADLTKRLDEKEKAEARQKLASEVAAKKGVPADLIVGEDEDEMNEWADRLLAYSKRKPAPKVEKPGSFDHGEGQTSELRDFARQLLGNE